MRVALCNAVARLEPKVPAVKLRGTGLAYPVNYTGTGKVNLFLTSWRESC